MMRILEYANEDVEMAVSPDISQDGFRLIDSVDLGSSSRGLLLSCT